MKKETLQQQADKLGISRQGVWWKTEKGKAYRKKYHWWKTKKGIAYREAYRQTPKYKARRKAYAKAYWLNYKERHKK